MAWRQLQKIHATEIPKFKQLGPIPNAILFSLTNSVRSPLRVDDVFQAALCSASTFFNASLNDNVRCLDMPVIHYTQMWIRTTNPLWFSLGCGWHSGILLVTTSSLMPDGPLLDNHMAAYLPAWGWQTDHFGTRMVKWTVGHSREWKLRHTNCSRPLTSNRYSVCPVLVELLAPTTMSRATPVRQFAMGGPLGACCGPT